MSMYSYYSRSTDNKLPVLTSVPPPFFSVQISIHTIPFSVCLSLSFLHMCLNAFRTGHRHHMEPQQAAFSHIMQTHQLNDTQMPIKPHTFHMYYKPMWMPTHTHTWWCPPTSILWLDHMHTNSRLQIPLSLSLSLYLSVSIVSHTHTHTHQTHGRREQTTIWE